MADHPELVGDFWALYQIELTVWVEEFRNYRLIASLLERLPHERKSMWAAKQRGGAEHFDWGSIEYQMAALIDSLGYNTSVTANHGTGRRAKVPKPSYRPAGTKNTQVIKPKSIKDMKGFTL